MIRKTVVLMALVFLASCGGGSNDLNQLQVNGQPLTIELPPDGEIKIRIHNVASTDTSEATRVVIERIDNLATTFIDLHDLSGTTFYSEFITSDLPMVLPVTLDNSIDRRYEITIKNIDSTETTKFDLSITGKSIDEGLRIEPLSIDLRTINTFIGQVEDASFYVLKVPSAGSYDLLFSFEAKTRFQFGAFDPARFGTFGVSCAYHDPPSFDCATRDITADADQQISLQVIHLEQPSGVFNGDFTVTIRPH